MSAPCVTCSKVTESRCGRCKAQFLCSKECQQRSWPTHKKECRSIAQARALFPNGVPQSPNGMASVPASFNVSELLELNQKTQDVYVKHGLSEPPTTRSTMSSDQKLAFFLDMLEAVDSSSPSNKVLPLNHQVVLNRRYNNTYRNAREVLCNRDFVQLERGMRSRGIGAVNKQP